MGAQQSSTGGAGQADAAKAPKTCYYELLGVEREATDLEIKKAYRRKALDLHPDRNLQDVGTATEKFAEVQSAYEILSDPQERAWYDAHRDTILSGQDGGPDDDAEPTTFRNVRLTTTEEIMGLIRRFNATVPFNDEPTGFFGITRETFEHLALEEQAAADFEDTDCPAYASFGSADDAYETTVRAFYSTWSGFSTRKTFSWKDKYRLSDAPDRRVRRLMEKENKKFRDEAIRDFNDAVRFLVTFVRKRDPRYLPNSQTASDRQESLRSASAAQAARSRAANQARLSKFDIPEWARARDSDSDQNPFSEEEEQDEDEENDDEILECVVCNKSFKSVPQLQAHERSKKHVKAVQRLRRQMRKEGKDLDINNEVPGKEQAMDDGLEQQESHATDEQAQAGEPLSEHGQDLGKGHTPMRDVPNDIDISAAAAGTLQDVELPLASTAEETTNISDSDEDVAPAQLTRSMNNVSIADDATPAKKIGKAKAKRQKKAAALQGSDNEHRCSVCRAPFNSRTKLFHHINAENHAAPVARASDGSQKKRKG